MADIKTNGKNSTINVNTALATLLSILYMGIGHFYLAASTLKHEEYKKYRVTLLVKGAFFTIVQTIALLNIPYFITSLNGLITLGTVTGQKLMKNNDHSIFMMAEGLIAALILLFVIVFYIACVRDAHKQSKLLKVDVHRSLANIDLGAFYTRLFPYVVLVPVGVLIVFFVMLPLVFSALIAFTNYSMPYNIPPRNLVDWVGFKNFVDMFKLPLWKDTFLKVFSWNVVWAITATLFNFFVGLAVALMLNSKDIKFAKGFRTIFILPYAIPQMVSLLIWKNLLNGQFGPINLTLEKLGLIQDGIPFLGDPFLAKCSAIAVNLWLGFPYFLLLLTGILTSISPSLYEAAKIDGATGWQQFKKITLPMVFFATAPLLIMTFSFNFNNFGAVYFLTGGGPNTFGAGSGAGATDILISWIFKLMENNQRYNMAAVLSLLVFTLIAPFAIYNFTRTKSFKEGEY